MKIIILALLFAAILLFGCTQDNSIEMHYRIVGTNVTCTWHCTGINCGDAAISNCGYSFSTPCSDGMKYKCVSVAVVD